MNTPEQAAQKATPSTKAARAAGSTATTATEAASNLFLEAAGIADNIVFVISLPSRWAGGIARAAEILRQKHPDADDAEIMHMMLLHGMVDVIDGANSSKLWAERNEDDQTIIAIAEALL